jgi:hypothetical protein
MINNIYFEERKFESSYLRKVKVKKKFINSAKKWIKCDLIHL